MSTRYGRVVLDQRFFLWGIVTITSQTQVASVRLEAIHEMGWVTKYSFIPYMVDAKIIQDIGPGADKHLPTITISASVCYQ